MANKTTEISKSNNNWLRRNAVKAIIILAAIAILTRNHSNAGEKT